MSILNEFNNLLENSDNLFYHGEEKFMYHILMK